MREKLSITMGAKKRHSLLGCKFDGSPAGWAVNYKKRFYGLGHYPVGWIRQSVREGDIIQCLGMLAMHHLGYKIPVDPEDWLNRGFDVTIDYFCGDWWKGDEDATESIDKTPGNEWIRWFNAFSRGLLLGLLSERWDEIAAVCGWVEPGLRAEALVVDDTEDVEVELPQVYLSVAASLRPEPMPGLEALEKRVRESKKPRPRLLFQAWEAARAGDQSAFDEGFVKCLAHFAAVACKGPTPIHWVATHQSVIALAASRLGIKLPNLPPKLDALVMTRASLGLESSHVLSPAPTTMKANRVRAKDRTGVDGKNAGKEYSPEYVASLVKQFKPKHTGNKRISAKNLMFMFRGAARAKAEFAGTGKALDRDSVKKWFLKNTPIDDHFDDRREFARYLGLALKILESEV